MLVRLFQLFHSKEFLVFLIVGCISAVVNLACGFALYHADLLPYTISVFLGASCGLVVNFLLNYVFTFHYKGRGILSQFWTFFIVANVGTVLTALTARISLAVLRWLDIAQLSFGQWSITNEFLAHAFAVALVTIYSYLAHKYFSFNVGFRERCHNFISRLGHHNRVP